MMEKHDQSLQIAVEQLLYQVAAACDQQDWDRYLSFFTPEVEFHLPQWRNEHEVTENPRREMSLIYYASRAGLEDRVFRLRTGKSSASLPMPRMLHLISNVRCQREASGEVNVDSNWVTHFWRLGESQHFYGYAYYRLCEQQGELKIARKHVVLLNDKIDSVLDFYHV